MLQFLPFFLFVFFFFFLKIEGSNFLPSGVEGEKKEIGLVKKLWDLTTDVTCNKLVVNTCSD